MLLRTLLLKMCSERCQEHLRQLLYISKADKIFLNDWLFVTGLHRKMQILEPLQFWLSVFYHFTVVNMNRKS